MGSSAVTGQEGYRLSSGSLVRGELIGVTNLVFVYPGFDVPAREIATIGPRKCSGAEAADGRLLPVAVVDASRILGNVWILEWQPDRSAPGSRGNCAGCLAKRRHRNNTRQKNRKKNGTVSSNASIYYRSDSNMNAGTRL